MGARRRGKLQDPPAALNRFIKNNIKEVDKKKTFYNEKTENRQRVQLNRIHHCHCNYGRTGCRMCPHVYQIYPQGRRCQRLSQSEALL